VWWAARASDDSRCAVAIASASVIFSVSVCANAIIGTIINAIMLFSLILYFLKSGAFPEEKNNTLKIYVQKVCQTFNVLIIKCLTFVVAVE
jgi:hypothetical protein